MCLQTVVDMHDTQKKLPISYLYAEYWWQLCICILLHEDMFNHAEKSTQCMTTVLHTQREVIQMRTFSMSDDKS